jgi:uncharacterized protein YjbI with pentapeptide repeats
MRWRKKNLRRIGLASAGLLFLLACVALLPLSAASAHEKTSGLVRVGAVTTQTDDATVMALSKEQLTQQVAQQQHTWDNWLWSNAATILSSFFSTLVIVIGALFGLWRWRADRRDAQDKELKERQIELEKRAEERFQAAVTGLGDDKKGAMIGAAILLRTFLHPGYERFYTQTFDLAVAHLRLPRTAHPSEEPHGISQSAGDSDTPLPLTTLSQALIVVFREAFPLARSQRKGSPPSLDASRVQLDYAYLRKADLKQVWMPQASLRKADLREADLREARLWETNFQGANFSGANLSGANLWRADLREANLTQTNIEDTLYLNETNLCGVKGLIKEQLEACKAKGAIIAEGPTTSPSQSTVALPSSSHSNDVQASSAPSDQEGISTPDLSESNIVSSSHQGTKP